MRLVEAALFSALLLPPGTPAPEEPRMARWHFVFGNVLGKDFELSILFRRTTRGDDTRLLVAVPAGRFVFISQQDPSGRDSTESVEEVVSGEVLQRRILLSGYDAVTACAPVKAPDACLLWTGAGGSFASGLSAFSGEASKATRGKVSGLVTERMKKSLFELAPILPAVAEFGSYQGDFLGLVWPERFPERSSLRRGKRTAGCDFDATFGYLCDAAEREKERKRFAN